MSSAPPVSSADREADVLGALTASGGVYLAIDPLGRITHARGAATDLLKPDERELRGRPVASALRDVPDLEAALRDALDGQHGVVRCLIGEDALDLRVAPLHDQAGDILGAVALGGPPPAVPVPASSEADPDAVRPGALVAEADEFPGVQTMEAALQSAIRAAGRGHESALVHVHLDDVPLVADAHGRDGADRFLEDAAATLRATFPRPTIIARVGPADFGLMIEYLPGDPSAFAAKIAAQAVDALASIVTVAGQEIRRTARASAALIQHDTEVPAELLRLAASTAAEQAPGRARIAHAPADRRNEAREELRIRARLPHAADRGELRLEYQPIYSFVRERVYGVEAFLRWTDAELGRVSPGRFIPIAEQSGAVHTLGAWVMEELCSHAATWHLEGRDFRVHFNASVAELERSDYARDMLRSLARHPLEPSSFVLEVTESAAALDTRRAATTLGELRAAGMRVAIGDFGSGEASLTRLRDLPADMLKIGRGMVADVAISREVRAIVAATVAMANDLGLETVAEGIETDEQRSLLQRTGCTHGQGYILGRPSESLPRR